MIEAHTLDAWTTYAARKGSAWAWAGILGGFAAPAFLCLAGVGVAMSAASTARRTGSRLAAVEAIGRRGLEIFILAFLFRLQAFIVSPGSYAVTLFRVDILNIMGPSIVATGLVWGLFRSPAALAAAYAAIACALAMVTPIVRIAPFVDRFPTWVQWYLRPAGDYTTFTAFPWAGFVFAGAACGALLAAARDQSAERRVQIGLGCAGLAVLGLGLYMASLPSIYRQSSYWTSSPTYFAVRTGILLIALTLIYALAQGLATTGVRLSALERFGRSSLFVYWIHVELVYGYVTWPLRRRLPLWGTVIAFTVFTVLMYGAIIWRVRVLEMWRNRQEGGHALGEQPIGRTVQF